MVLSCLFDLASAPEVVWTIISSVIAAASIAIKFLPELPEDSKWKPILRFIGKFLALNRTSSDKKLKVEV
jgi:hypothetical protein